MSSVEISIIMPVYNGAQFIKQTLDSLCPQLTNSVELIVVNDGSQDDTLAVIERYFSSFIQAEKLQILSQNNQGVSVARNLGIEHACGNYIGFMDADDLALPNYIASLLNAVAQNVDIVEFGFKTFVSSVEEINTKAALYTNNQFGLHTVSNVIDKVYSTARWYPWARIFKKHLLQGVRFPLGVRFCEDLMTIPQLYEKAQTILVLRDALYGYRTNPNSATFKVGDNYVEKLVSFYHGIPKSGFIRHDYLRMSVAFGIISCQTKSNGSWVLPKTIQQDLYKMRWTLSIYRNLETRRILVLLYPMIYKLLLKINVIFKKPSTQRA